MYIRAAALALTATLVPLTAYAQDPPATPPETQAQDAGGGRGGRAPEPQIRSYDRVITKEAKSDEGVFTVHRIKNRLRATDRATRLHLEDVRMQIARALDPAVTESGPAGVRALNDMSDFDVSVDPLACWVDYAIRVKQ